MADSKADVMAVSFDHHMRVDSVSDRVREVLVVVANPTVSSNNNWPVGFWGAELTHPYYEFTEAGLKVTIASPDGGKVEMDALSDPRDPSRWSSEDLITMGFVNTPELVALLEDTPALDSLDLSRFEALLIAGGQSPMFTFRDNKILHRAIRDFWDAEKVVAAYCHGVAALVDCDSPTARRWSTAAPSPASPTWRRTTAIAPSGCRSCPGGSRTPCVNAAPTTSGPVCSRPSPSATAA